MTRLVRFLVLLASLALLTATPGVPAPAAKAPLFQHPVHRGSTGKQVLAAKWLLSGHDPSVYRKTVRTFRGPMTKKCGKPCVRAILGARWLLGEPIAYKKKCPSRTGKQRSFGRNLYLILTGAKARPVCWIGRASQRVKVHRTQTVNQGSSCAQRVVAAARLELGVHEVPWGSNTGPRVRYYQRHTVLGRQGYTGFPWCVAFAQTIYVEAGIGEIADGTAGVKYAYGWAQPRGWLSSRPVVGAWVSFLANAGHQGLVTGVTPSGFSTFEGNCKDQVCSRSYPLGYRMTVFIVPPCVRARVGRRH